MGKQTKKNLFIAAGVIGIMMGLSGVVPFTAKEMYFLAILSWGLVIAGIIILAIAFGD